MALLDDEETGAAFGFFPQMQPRRRLQDIQGSANLPVDVTRGRLAGLLGLIPDVLNFMGRSPMPTETFGETQYNPRPQLPYDTDFYLKNLPLAPTSRAGQVAGQAASFVPLNPAPLVRAGVAGAQALAPTAARMTENYLQRQGFMPGVVPVENKNMLSYRGSHTAPGPDFGAPLHDLTGGGQMYPADVYSAKAAQYYGTGYPKADKEAFALAQRVRGNPNAEITMYRAVPKDENITNINAGDWVSLSKDYAKTHGESVLQGDYKILSQKVKAKDLWTNADSIHEFGYQPQKLPAPDLLAAQQDEEMRKLQQLGLLGMVAP
jgi:hypothetical protein